MANYNLLKRELNQLLEFVSDSFTSSELNEVKEFLDAGEFGLALETLYFIIIEEDKCVSPSVRDSIEKLGELMNLESIEVNKISTTQ